jgi:acyl-coenzyme A thioesterase PaaI-like protein
MEEMQGPQSIQDQIGGNHCWGCGTLNPHGLQIKSYLRGEEAICEFMPLPEQMAGPTHLLNGGIIATLIDCHSVCTAIASAYQSEGRPIGSDPELWYATASLQVEYLRPTNLRAPVILRARVVAVSGRKITVHCSLSSGDEVTARAEVLAVRVPPEWKAEPAPA